MKPFFISDFLSAIIRQLPTICQESINILEDLTANFPGLLSNTLIFEYCLDGENTTVDLSLGIMSGNSNRQLLLAGLHPGIDLPQNLLENKAWQQVRSFAREWSDEDSIIHDVVDTIWLEFDTEPNAISNCPIPGFFFASDRITGDSVRDINWITDDALRLILGRNLKTNVANQINRTIYLLPKEARASSFGIMLSRQEERVRMITSNMPSAQILNYLDEIGWSGDREKVKLITNTFGKLVKNINLSIDLGSSIGSRLGLEIRPDSELAFEEKTVKWQQIFEILLKHELCTNDICQEILSFSGVMGDQMLSEMSETWQYAKALIGNSAYSCILKDISHLKIVIDAERSLQAKIYLRVGQAWITKQEVTNTVSS